MEQIYWFIGILSGIFGMAIVGIPVVIKFYKSKKINTSVLEVKNKMSNGLVLFVTGTNGVGKTTITAELAKALNIKNIVGTNDVRQALRSRDDLFLSAGKKDEYDLLGDSTYELDGHDDYQAQCELLTKTIVSIANYNRKNPCTVIEGINISPNDIGITEGRSVFINLYIDSKPKLFERLGNKARTDKTKEKLRKKIDNIMNTQKIIAQQFLEVEPFGNRFRISNEGNIQNTVLKIIEELKKYLQNNPL